MEIKQQTSADATARPVGVEVVACPNCQAGLVRGMRFCRRCGYRLGEGLAEYNETMRFDGRPPMPVVPYAPPTMPQPPAQPTTALAPVTRSRSRRSCGRGHRGWLMW